MATVEELKGWFERDLKSAGWDENVEFDDSDPNNVTIRLYTQTNEYTLKVVPRDEGIPRLNCTVKSRKPRAGLPAAAPRPLLRNPQFPNRLNERTWRRLLGAIVGFELVRVHRPETAEKGKRRAAKDETAAASDESEAAPAP
ncbi:MAG TPA: hypothetical protein VM755_15205 [Stellaceae bacterium]|nr:hypothetical protein [Stellaceae bacterium]